MPKNSIDHCKDCGVRLKNTKHIRTRPMSCPDCVQKLNPSVRDIFKEMQRKPTTPAPDEMWFEDDPRAVNEIEYGRVSRVSNAAPHETTLSEVII
tara:strand:- start:2971 stop:3255 length:285 start_codon:yes stop_codon:yes gene_type:complete